VSVKFVCGLPAQGHHLLRHILETNGSDRYCMARYNTGSGKDTGPLTKSCLVLITDLLLMRDGVTGECRKLQSEELHNLFSSLSSIRKITSRRICMGHLERMREEPKVHKVLVGKSERKRPFGRPSRRWEKGIRTDLREIGWEGVKWIQLA
jgi:hypothetical protein